MKENTQHVSVGQAPVSTEVQSTLAITTRWISDFNRKLQDEVTLLHGDELEGLQYIGEKKQQLLHELASLEPKLISVFAQSGHLAEVREIKMQLQQCKDQNLENQRIVLQQLKHTNKGLELLRSLLKMNDLSLYSDNGQLRIKREKRHIGSA